MCITFVFVSSENHLKKYRLIIASNRDEYYDRKSKAADVWDDYPFVIGGRDLQSASRGSWLAWSKYGKIAVLLNIHRMKDDWNKNLESRGSLVTNFLNSELQAPAYCHSINHKNYPGYHLLMFNIDSNEIQANLLTNEDSNTDSEIIKIIPGIHGFSNSSVQTPYKKVIYGKTVFGDIIHHWNNTDEKNTLHDELLMLLKSELRCYPDEILYETKKNMMGVDCIEQLSSIFVKMPTKKYGTRTHTILLVSHDNEVEYHEYTMKEPINDPEEVEWLHHHFTMPLIFR